jgi:DNA helicase-2/ATP-dependent DNA helicase PcrA
VEDLGSSRKGRRAARDSAADDYARASRPRPRGQPQEQESTHYAYEDEDQSAVWSGPQKARTPAASYSGKSYNSIENIADFFASRGKKFSVPKLPVEEPKGKKGFRPGQKVRHPKYGEGTVYQREGEGEDAKITVQFPRFGLKKLVEKYAQLEGVSS